MSVQWRLPAGRQARWAAMPPSTQKNSAVRHAPPLVGSASKQKHGAGVVRANFTALIKERTKIQKVET